MDLEAFALKCSSSRETSFSWFSQRKKERASVKYLLYHFTETRKNLFSKVLKRCHARGYGGLLKILLLRQLLVASQTVWTPKRTDNFGLAWENVTLRFTATIQSIVCF